MHMCAHIIYYNNLETANYCSCLNNTTCEWDNYTMSVLFHIASTYNVHKIPKFILFLIKMYIFVSAMVDTSDYD